MSIKDSFYGMVLSILIICLALAANIEYHIGSKYHIMFGIGCLSGSMFTHCLVAWHRGWKNRGRV